MRILTQASVVFFLIDDYTKDPLTKTAITCNGKMIPYVKKDDGYNVFIDLGVGKYKFDITAPGFVPMSYDIELTKVQPVQLVVPMKYSIDNLKAHSLPKIVFTVKKDGKPLKEHSVKVLLNTKVPSLRVIEPIARGKNVVAINADYSKKLLYQEYSYDKKSNVDVFFVEYDGDNQVYLTREYYKSKISEGGLLKPVWRYKTNIRGEFLLPVNPMFISEGEAEFIITVDENEINKKIDINGNNHVTIEI